MRDFRKLDVWKKSHALTLEVYQLTTDFPADERFGLSSSCNVLLFRLKQTLQKVAVEKPMLIFDVLSI